MSINFDYEEYLQSERSTFKGRFQFRSNLGPFIVKNKNHMGEIVLQQSTETFEVFFRHATFAYFYKMSLNFFLNQHYTLSILDMNVVK
jgi:hypothetical protein